MSKPACSAALAAALCAAVFAPRTVADESNDSIVTHVSAEVMTHSQAGPDGQRPEQRLQAAGRAVPGDVLIYTVEVRNTGQYSVESAVIVQRVPRHTMYVADSAAGPGVDVDYSVDGGHTFGKPETLKSSAAGATAKRVPRASAAEYTHIRWRLHNRLKPEAVAFVRFRAQVK